jgi:hypothetical protein
LQTDNSAEVVAGGSANTLVHQMPTTTTRENPGSDSSEESCSLHRGPAEEQQVPPPKVEPQPALYAKFYLDRSHWNKNVVVFGSVGNEINVIEMSMYREQHTSYPDLVKTNNKERVRVKVASTGMAEVVSFAKETASDDTSM